MSPTTLSSEYLPASVQAPAPDRWKPVCSLLQVRCMAGILHPLVLLEAWEAGLGKALSCHEGAQDGPMGGGRGRPVLRAPSHIPPEQMSSTLALEMWVCEDRDW